MRQYIRVDPNLPDHKEHYPDGAFTAFQLTMCFAEQQPHRGRFRNSRVLSALLGRRARWIPFLIQHGDLVVVNKEELYFDGWDEWQEGDWKVAERMKRVRERHRSAQSVTPADTPPVTPSDTAAVTVAGVSGPSELQAVGGKRLATSGKPPAVSGNASKKATSVVNGVRLDAIRDPDEQDLALELAAAVSAAVLKRYLSPLEVALCEQFILEYAYLSLEDMVQRMRDQLAWAEENHHEPPASLAWFTQSLRIENDHRADAGQTKAWRPPPVAGDLAKLRAGEQP